jgi:N-acetyl-alpha-D-muramate 1-phosphate uridylyltransferase
MLPVVILAGGLATRLRPLTDTIPKALVELNGKPFVEHQLLLLRERGVTRVVFCLGYRAEQIRECVGNGLRFGLQIDYSLDGPRLLGTAGAVRQALPLLGTKFFLLYGDSYLPCDYGKVEDAFLESGKLGLMTVFRNEGRFDASNVEFSSGHILEYSKKSLTARMQHIDYGLGALSSRAFEALPEGDPCDLATVYRDLLRREELAGFEVQQRFYEIGSAEGIIELSKFLSTPARRTQV